eukprot:s2382_g14.t1
MEEKALWQYNRFVYANQVDTFTFDTMLSGVVERIEEQWQISLRTDDLEVRYDENNGLEAFQVTRDQPLWNLRKLLDQFKMPGIKRDAAMAHLTWPTDSRPPTSGSASSQSVLPLPPPHVGDLIGLSGTTMDYDTTYGAADIVPAAPFIPDATDDDRVPVAELNLETNSFREHQVEFFFYKLVGDWHTAQKMGNYWRQHYGPETLPVDPVPAPEVRDPTAGVLPDVSTLDLATVYAAQLMTVCRSLPPAAFPEQQRNQLLRLVQDSKVRNLFTPIDMNTLATQIHQLAGLLTKANALPMEVHLTPTDAAQL